MSSNKWTGVAIASLLALAGCDAGRNFGRSPEERINEARPAQGATLDARRSLESAVAQDTAAGAELQRDLATRDKVRALTCAKGFSPSLFQSKDAVAQKLPDQKCFDDFDRATLEWLRARKLRWLLAAGPLRTAPPAPVDIFATTGGVNTIKFATDAPIAVVTSNDTVEVIDVGTGASIFLDRKLPQHPSSLAIAPNGRVFAVGGSEGVSLRDAESGEMLLELPEHQRFAWLDSETGLALQRNRASADLIDFANDARAEAVRGIDANVTRVLTLPGKPHQFVLGSFKSILRYSWTRDANGVHATLQAQKAGPPMSWNDNLSEPTTDSAWFVQAANDLWITNLETLDSEQIPLRPFYAQFATPLPNPDEVLLFGALVSRSKAPPLIYSIANRTFAPVDDEQLTGMPGYAGVRTVFIPALKRIAVVTGTKVKLLSEVKRGPRYGLDALVQMLAEQQRIQQEQDAKAALAREGLQLDRVVDGIAVASSPLLAAAKDAQIEAVGVYESAYGSHTPMSRSIAGIVTVALRPSSKPIVLVLTSYEPVTWKISGASSARLKAVLLGGYYPSTVSGEEGVQVIQMGNHYAYEQGGSGFGALQREVVKRTGKSIDTFQGRYSGTQFMVGGR